MLKQVSFSAVAALALCAGAAAAAEGELEVFANGEELATEGFVPPALTRDGWELKFEHIYVTLSNISALQADPPFDAETNKRPSAQVIATLETEGPIVVDLVNVDDDGRVRIGSVKAPAGHYNAVSWSVVPAPSGEWEGKSMVFIGTATKDERNVRFTLVSEDTHVYTCGEYIGDERKGFLQEGGYADLELTFHLDHIFGRSDFDEKDPLNTSALGFDPFAEGGEQRIQLSGLHIGHVGEGHCAVESR